MIGSPDSAWYDESRHRKECVLADYTIADLQFREVVRDSDNYLAEASIDIRGDFAVMVYGRYRGMVHSDDGDILCVTSRDAGSTWDDAPAVVMAHFPPWGFTSPGVKILADGLLLAIAHANERGRPGGFVFCGAYSARSTDGGRTWSVPGPLLAWPMRAINIWDNPLELHDGTVLAVFHVFSEQPKQIVLLASFRIAYAS